MLITVLMTAAAVVVMSVVITAGIRIILRISFGKRLRCFIGRTPDAAIKFNSGIRKCHLRTHADPAADQGIRFCCLQETGKCAVSASAKIVMVTSSFPNRSFRSAADLSVIFPRRV